MQIEEDETRNFTSNAEKNFPVTFNTAWKQILQETQQSGGHQRPLNEQIFTCPYCQKHYNLINKKDGIPNVYAWSDSDPVHRRCHRCLKAALLRHGSPTEYITVNEEEENLSQQIIGAFFAEHEIEHFRSGDTPAWVQEHPYAENFELTNQNELDAFTEYCRDLMGAEYLVEYRAISQDLTTGIVRLWVHQA